MQRLLLAGVLVFLAGVGLVFVGAASQGSGSVGGVIFIGPFPIVFGSGPGGTALALGSVLIGGIMLILILLWGRRLSRIRSE